MPEKVIIREDLQVIQVQSFGEVPSTDMEQSLEEILKIYKDRGLSRVFVDAT